MKKALLSALALAASVAVAAQDPWLHIYYAPGISYLGLPTDSIASMKLATADDPQHVDDVYVTDTSGHSTYINAYEVRKIVHGANVPAISITTDRPVDEIPDKENYLDATITVDGRGAMDDFEGRMQIRGRGNSTWKYKKKPYRVKFDKKTSMLGFKKMKNYVLLANYIDPSQMRNVLAMKVAQLVGCDFVNTMVPVDLTLNGKYRGSYLVTEKVGINSSSVDVEETQSILWELDKNYDETYRFKSPIYQLPVMVKDPDMDCDPNVAPQTMFEKWKADFIEFERQVDAGNLDAVCDIEGLAKYLYVFTFTMNHEPRWPKSVYLWKTIDPAATEPAKYHFGPVWDFDWCYGYIDGKTVDFESASTYMFNSPKDPGQKLFGRMLQDKKLIEAIRRVHDDFMANHLAEFWQFFDEYAAQIEPSASANYQKWNIYAQQPFSKHAALLRQWIEQRLAFIDKDKNLGLINLGRRYS